MQWGSKQPSIAQLKERVTLFVSGHPTTDECDKSRCAAIGQLGGPGSSLLPPSNQPVHLARTAGDSSKGRRAQAPPPPVGIGNPEDNWMHRWFGLYPHLSAQGRGVVQSVQALLGEGWRLGAKFSLLNEALT